MAQAQTRSGKSINSYIKTVLGVVTLLLVTACLILEKRTNSFLTLHPEPGSIASAVPSMNQYNSVVSVNGSAERADRKADLEPDYDSFMREDKDQYEQNNNISRPHFSPTKATTVNEAPVYTSTSSTIKQNVSSLPIWKRPPNLPWVRRELRVDPDSLMSLSWVKDLQTFLRFKVDRKWPIAIVSSNMAYRASLLNWLVHTLVRLGNDTIQNVLVLSMDEELHNFLQERSLPSLLVPPGTLSKVPRNRWQKIHEVEIARLFVMRLINLWGYDVVNYDNDAIVLNNPQSLYDLYPDSDVIGSESFMPKDLHKMWGVTLCMGTVLLRASTATEILWSTMHDFDVSDDQKKLNYALKRLQINWDKHDSRSQPWRGFAPLQNKSSNLTVTVLPMDSICRGAGCNVKRVTDYYVWHQGGNHDYKAMILGASKARVWVLRKDWKSLETSNINLTGSEWLRTVMIE